jgi:hypothetical protein
VGFRDTVTQWPGSPVTGAQWINDHVSGERKFLVYEEAGRSAILGATSENSILM